VSKGKANTASISSPASRQRVIRVIMAVALVGLGIKLVDIQLLEAPALAKAGLDTRMRTTAEPAVRGSITTADGVVLAEDVERYEIQVNQLEVADFKRYDDDDKLVAQGPEGAARVIAPLLGLDEKETLGKLIGDKTWVPLVKDATLAQYRAVSAARVTGIYGKKEYKRYYPAGALAGNLVGFPFELDTDEDGAPKHYTGVEDTQNDHLQGTPGKGKIEVGNGGPPIPGGVETVVPAKPGCDITMTLDSTIQFEARKAIDAQVAATQARGGMAVVMDLQTGEILALADSGQLDPNDPAKTGDGTQGSRALQSIFEPGSTGKVVTMAMVIEEGQATPATTYTVPYAMTLSGQVYHDSSDHGTRQLTLNGILGYSSNVGTVMSAQNIPDQVRYDYLSKFGFGKKTGLEVPGETEGILHSPGTDAWDGRTRNVVLFGQGVAVNAVQATAVFATIGNGGVAMPAHLIKGRTCDGEYTPTNPGEPTQVVSPETANQVLAMLESAVGEGTGENAKLDNYRTAGKTGTAEMIVPGEDTWYVSSFVGVAPAEAPRVAVGVYVLDSKAGPYGATVAAPVFKDLTTKVMERLAVPPSTTQPASAPLTW
jgi:cell division protein FtsI (penicillin-binding protein 3)